MQETLQVFLELEAQLAAMLLNHFTRNKWEMLIRLLLLQVILQLLTLLDHVRNDVVALHKVIVQFLLTLRLSQHVLLLVVFNVHYVILRLLPIRLMIKVCSQLFFSHLLHMMLHDVVVCQLLTLVHSFTEFGQACTRHVVCFLISEIADTFELICLARLWIGICHV